MPLFYLKSSNGFSLHLKSKFLLLLYTIVLDPPRPCLLLWTSTSWASWQEISFYFSNMLRPFPVWVLWINSSLCPQYFFLVSTSLNSSGYTDHKEVSLPKRDYLWSPQLRWWLDQSWSPITMGEFSARQWPAIQWSFVCTCSYVFVPMYCQIRAENLSISLTVVLNS